MVQTRLYIPPSGEDAVSGYSKGQRNGETIFSTNVRKGSVAVILAQTAWMAAFGQKRLLEISTEPVLHATRTHLHTRNSIPPIGLSTIFRPRSEKAQ